MKGQDLMTGLNFVDEKFIHEAEHKTLPKTRSSAWRIIGTAAACLAVVASSVWLLHGAQTPIGTDPEKNPGQSQVSPGDHTGPTQQYDVTFQQATSQLSNDLAINGHFWQELSAEEAEGVFHALAQKHEISATAHFSNTEAGISLYHIESSIEVTKGVFASVTVSPNEIATCYVLEGTPTPSKVNGIAVSAGYFNHTNNNKTIYYAEFEIDGVFYRTEITGGEAEKEALLELIDAITQGGKADLSCLQPLPPSELRNDTLTLQQAYEDEMFGSYLPLSFPSGYSLNGAYRLMNQTSDTLVVSLSEGYHDIRWQVSLLAERDKARITSTQDSENYNLELYPIPRFDSVPEALQEIVNNPIFLIDDLTIDAINMRLDTSDDPGTTANETLNFSVLYGDVLVEVSTQGISSETLYDMLLSLK